MIVYEAYTRSCRISLADVWSFWQAAFELGGSGGTVAWCAVNENATDDQVAAALGVKASDTPGLLLLSQDYYLNTRRAAMKFSRKKAELTTESVIRWVRENK